MSREEKSDRVIEEIDLLDGTTVTLRKASITVLKKIMKTLKKLQAERTDEQVAEVDDDEYFMDVLIEMSAIALSKQYENAHWVLIPEDTKNAEKKAERATLKEAYEDALDMDIVARINEVCGGVKFDDPNLLAAISAATELESQADGTTLTSTP